MKSKSKNKHEKGEVSFTPEDLKQAAQSDPRNARAYELLDAAMTTSSHITVEDKKNFENGGTVDIDDTYPITAEETAEMEHLLDEAEKAAGNPNDELFSSRLNELRDIVAFSKKRHWNFSWLVILGVFIMVCVLGYWASDNKQSMKKAKEHLAYVKNWTEMDTTIAFPNEKPAYTFTNTYNANTYKETVLQTTAHNYYQCLEDKAYYQHRADTTTNKDLKKSSLEQVKKKDKKSKELREAYDDMNKMKFKDVKKVAVKEAKVSASRTAHRYRVVWLWNMFFILLIPLYIFADRPYGYMLSRHRTEAKMLGGAMKIATGIAGFLAGSALSMEFLPDTVWKYSDGHTEREGNAGNIAIIAIKIGLYIAALAILSITACFVMTYATVTGLMRNYDWQPIIAAVKAKLPKKAEPAA